MVKIVKNSDRITIGFAGDVMIGRLVNDHLRHALATHLWGNTLPLLRSTDLNLINLEAALTKSEQIVPKVFNFKADPKHVQVLKEASIHVVNLANNHVLDYGVEGLLETLETLDQAQIQHVGAGKTSSEASKPIILSRKGICIGMIGCTDNEPTWKADQNKPGTFYIEIGDIETIKKAIIPLRQRVDLLILSMHWGPNMRERPSEDFIKFAHQLIDVGVDIFHGHSAHIFQGIEIYKNKIIFYDTGDFVDDYYVDPLLRNDRSFFFVVETDGQKLCSLRLVPTLISHFQVNLSHGKDAMETLQRMQELSKEFGTSLIISNGELVVNLV